MTILIAASDHSPGCLPDTWFAIAYAQVAISHSDDPIAHMSVRDEKGIRPGGLGILMVKAFADELLYNEKHNEVVFIKYL